MTTKLSLLFFLLPTLIYQLAPEKIMIKNETFYGVKSIPDYNIIGLYNFENGHPIVSLDADGTGVFEKHDNVPVKIKWWVECDKDGVVKVQKGVLGQVHRLIIQYLEPQYIVISGVRKIQYEANEYDMFDMTIRYDQKKIYILGERVKPF